MSNDPLNQPSSAEHDHLLVKAQQYYSKKDYIQAQKICRTIVNENPTHKVALYLLALCQLYSGHQNEAATTLKKLVKCYPKHINGLVLLSKIYLNLGDHLQSTQNARQALELNVKDDRVLALLAGIFGNSEDHYSAKIAYKRAIQINPDNATHRCNYASILRIEGRIDESINTLEKCIELDANNCKAHLILSSLKRQTRKDNHVQRLTQVRDNPKINSEGKMLINFALSNEYEDIGEYKRSFDHLSQACSSKRKSIQYDFEKDKLQFRQLEDLFDSAYIRKNSDSGYTDYAPVFVVGMPRTGSTLIEQILGANKKLFAAGELSTFGNEITSLFQNQTDQTLDFSMLDSLEVNYHELGRNYVNKSMAFINSARHKSAFDSSITFIDKMPQNFLYIGFILLALPNAKIIVTEKGAMDTCLSNFKQLYNDPFYQFSYQLDELGKYFIEYHRLMRHWKSLFGRRLFILNYEKFVNSPELNAEKIFKYCALTWRNDYLDYARQVEHVATASATQIRNAIHTNSVHRWKKYQRQLSPLAAQLYRAELL